MSKNQSTEPNDNQDVLTLAMQGFTEALNGMRQPKTIIRDENGRAQGIM